MTPLASKLATALHKAIPHWHGHLPETPEHHAIHEEHATALLAELPGLEELVEAALAWRQHPGLKAQTLWECETALVNAVDTFRGAPKP